MLLDIGLMFLGMVVSVPLSALGFRWAGGLLSQWAGRDLGNFMPRQLWGLTATVALIPEAVVVDMVWYWKVLILVSCSVLTGIMRGFGWGNSLTLGYVKVGGPLDNTATQKLVRMTISHLAMQFFVFLAAVLFGVFGSAHIPGSVWLAGALMMLWAAVTSSFGYREAWQSGGLDMPKLGCSVNDPPPTGELFAGAICALNASVFGFLIWAIYLGTSGG